MNPRPVVLFYCQHSLGMGHLVRSIRLAAGLSDRFRVVFLNGGLMPRGINLPEGVEVIQLPPLGLDSDGQIVSRDRRRTVDRARELRRKMILEAFDLLRPQIVLIELFPFGRKKFSDELMPLLYAAREARPLVVCSLRDILVGSRSNQQKHDERAVAIANNYFDAILVHSDPAFARLEESFNALSKLTTPVRYTGYVSPERDRALDSNTIRHKRVVVSAGGGLVGHALFQTAIEAHALLREDEVEMKIIAGPFLPDEAWRSLRRDARGKTGLQLIRCVPDLCEEMQSAAASISQCGYNTSLDLLQSGVAALVVPYAEGSEDEQTRRAARLEQIGAVRVLDHTQMTAIRLAGEIRSLLDFKPKAATINMNGQRASAQIIESLFYKRQAGNFYSYSIPGAIEEVWP
ncbi:MAG: glycosyltransferase [Blastocatellia bacterium]